jgi:hypothetical protein
MLNGFSDPLSIFFNLFLEIAFQSSKSNESCEDNAACDGFFGRSISSAQKKKSLSDIELNQGVFI